MKLFLKKSIKFLLLSIIVFIFSGCSLNNQTSSKGNGKSNITLWSGGSDNVKVTWEKLAKEFNTNSEYADKYNLNIEFISSGTGATSLFDRVLASYKAGEKESDFDIIEVSSSEYATYVSESDENIFVKLDNSKINNISKLEAKVSEGQEHIVPYRGTTVVLLYDSEVVKNPPKTADEMYKWIKENPGKFAYCTPGSGGSGQSFVITGIYNFLEEEKLHKSDKSVVSEWDKGFELLKELHPYLYKSGGKVIYPHKNQGAMDLIANKQIAMTPAWVDMVVAQLNAGTLPETVKMTQLKEKGFTGQLANLAIPSSSKNIEGAHAVLNFMLSDKAQEILLEEMGAFPVIDMSNVDSKNKKLMEGFDISSFRTYDIGTLTQDIVKRWDSEIGILE